MIVRRSLACALAFAAVACSREQVTAVQNTIDTRWRIDGTVVDPTGDPVGDAIVTVKCSDSSPAPRSITGRDGLYHFVGDGGALFIKSCDLVVEKGFWPSKTVKASAGCVRIYGDSTPCGPTEGRIQIGP